MFDIAWSEFLVVAVVALVVVGPRDLPALLRNVGKMVSTVRRMAGEFQTQFSDAMREAELDELQRDITGIKDSAAKLMSAPNPLQIARDEIKNAIDGRPTAAPSALAGDASQGPAAAETPSAFAPHAPHIEPVETPPAPASTDFAPASSAPKAAKPKLAGPKAAGAKAAGPKAAKTAAGKPQAAKLNGAASATADASPAPKPKKPAPPKAPGAAS
ncbi:Sec-independent protein translocase protein TatB [Hansschlegelia sp. KR7-227]|uniref:Sec-independent protein translocase protein TatB n=1 Tax=Hansschlegelia sp. KR7-227 TaxID=3400914 RepID=UPI003C0B74AA